MNKRIKNLSYERLLFVDIETVRGCNDFDENHPYYDVWAWKQRDKQTSKIPEALEVIESYNNKSALFAEWGKIVCISVGYIHNEELFVKSFTGEESDILKSYVDIVKKTSRMPVGHNLIPFDNNYIRKKWFINNLGNFLSEKQGNDVYCKPWDLDDALFDTMVAWKGASYNNSSLDELAMCFNIPSSKDKMHGNEVSDYYYDGKLDEIVEYCEKDVVVVANIIRRWKGDDILEPTLREEVKPKKLTLLQKLYQQNELTDYIKEDIEKLIAKKKLTKKDKENLFTILRGVYVRTDFVQNDQDNKKIVLEKELEIREFIDEL